MIKEQEEGGALTIKSSKMMNIIFHYLPADYIKIDEKLKGEKSTKNFYKSMLKFRSPLKREFGTSPFWLQLVFIGYVVISVAMIFLSIFLPELIKMLS